MTFEDAALRLHVATDGCDGWSGLQARPSATGSDGPLASIAAARDRIRAIRGAGRLAGPVEVLVHAGRYELAETLRFDGADLGDEASPVTYRSAGDGEVRLSGSRRLDGFTSSDGPVVRLSLRQAGLQSLALRQLCFNGSWLRPARYPSFVPDNPIGGGWLHVPGALVDIHEDGHGERDSFPTDDDRPASWSRLDDVELVVFPRYNYGNDVVPVADFDEVTGEVRLASPATSEIYPGDRFFYQNVLEELNQPGEWCVDRSEEMLHLYPPSPVDEAVVETPVLETAILVEGVPPQAAVSTVEKDTWFDHGKAMAHQHHPSSFTSGHLTFEGLIIEGCSGDAIVVRNVRGCRVVGCTVRTAGGFGIRVISGAACAVVDCDITDVGKGGIEASGGFRNAFSARYEPCEHTVRNNYVHHFGQVHKHVAGIAANGVGISVAHNLIHDGPRWGVLARGNDHVIEYNYIRHVCLESADTSAIYMVDRDFTMRGTKIRYNHIHDVLGFDRVGDTWMSPAYAFGIYLDDFTSGVDIRGNLIHGTPRAGIYVHAGQDNVVEENICMVTGNEAIYMRRWPPKVELAHCGTHDQGLRRNTLRRNILGPAARPYLFNNVHDTNGEADLRSNVYEDNLVVGEPGPVTMDSVEVSWQQWQAQGHDTASVIATQEAIFDGDSFRLRADGPAASFGIDSPVIDRMGVQSSPARASWPIVEALGARERMAQK